MAHALEFDHETATDVVFYCPKCQNVIGFNKQGIGEPCATGDAVTGFIPPDNPDQWMGPCNE